MNENIDHEKRVLELCAQVEKGITYKVIQNDMPSLKLNDIQTIINKLLKSGKLDLLQKGSDLILKIKDSKGAVKYASNSVEEKIIVQLVDECEDKGIQANEIRYKLNLPLNTVNKVLKKLELDRVVKSFQAVNRKAKRFILFNREPSRELLGGAFYSDNNFDSEFIEILAQTSYNFLESRSKEAQTLTGPPNFIANSSLVSSSDVLTYIKKSGITKVDLTLTEMESILDTLVYDGKVKKTLNFDGTKSYSTVNSFAAFPAILSIPCGVCPFIKKCAKVGEIAPKNCKYFDDWLLP